MDQKKATTQLALYALLLFVIYFFNTAKANDVTVSNISISEIDYNSSTALISFDISWQNSWRSTAAPGNFDATWVFFKIRKSGSAWSHGHLDLSNSTTPANVEVVGGLLDPHKQFNAIFNPVMGIFVQRATDGTGTFSASGVEVGWSFSEVGFNPGDTIDLMAVAIEMVYIPQGSFYLGDGTSRVGGTLNHFFDASSSAGEAVLIGPGTPVISDRSDGLGQSGDIAFYSDTADSGSLPATRTTLPDKFPSGYQAFYAMKYPISQNDWITFFNTLDENQKPERDLTSNLQGGKNSDTIVDRNAISWTGGTSDASLVANQYGEVACNFLAWNDVAAFLDWAALRPMTELEYEKLARGDSSQPPVAGEYVWGTNGGVVAVTGFTNGGSATEIPANGTTANLVYDSNVTGPARVGSLAAGSSNRIDSGAGYYGAMELSGNLFMFVIDVGQQTGWSFEGKHGDGLLSSLGYANTTGWPGSGSQQFGFRGGSWRAQSNTVLTSSRRYIQFSGTGRGDHWGGRGARNGQ